MDKKLKIILIGITLLCLTSLTVSATSLIKSSDVVYDNAKSGIESTTVQGAVDELYSAATDYSSLATRVTALEENKFLDSHPVGSIYLTISENENTITKMHNLYGGTWESYGQGRTLVGVGTGTDSNGTIKVFNKDESLGEYNHTLTISEMPSHNHQTVYLNTVDTEEETWAYLNNFSGGVRINPFIPILTHNQGGSQSHNNVQPYTTVYMYKRVS